MQDRKLDVIVVGSGVLGGWLALDYAVRRPQRVSRLVLRCPSSIGRQKTATPAASLLLLTSAGGDDARC